MSREVIHTLQYNWSRTVWVITFGFFILAVAVIGLLIAAIAQGSVVAGVIGLVIALPIFVAIALYTEGYSPQRLEVSASQITVLRRGKRVRSDCIVNLRTDVHRILLICHHIEFACRRKLRDILLYNLYLTRTLRHCCKGNK